MKFVSSLSIPNNEKQRQHVISKHYTVDRAHSRSNKSLFSSAPYHRLRSKAVKYPDHIEIQTHYISDDKKLMSNAVHAAVIIKLSPFCSAPIITKENGVNSVNYWFTLNIEHCEVLLCLSFHNDIYLRCCESISNGRDAIKFLKNSVRRDSTGKEWTKIGVYLKSLWNNKAQRWRKWLMCNTHSPIPTISIYVKLVKQ